MKVYLIRHAQSAQNVMDLRVRTSVADFNELLRFSAHHPLTAEGERQARALADRLSGAHVTRLYSSPFARALATAQLYGAPLGLEAIIVDELSEVVPDLLSERHRPSSLRRHYLRSFARMAWARNGPTWRSEYRRAKAAWGKITAEPAEEVAAVSHGWLITLMILSLRRDKRWRVLHRDVRNAGVSVITSR
jgi:broad specificity phosphatase PhoE